MTEFFGKYRGKVKTNQDPKNIGRLQVIVPEVLEADNENWALPCLPYAGKDIGMFTIPPEGANIWVEFEGGNRERPIWTGCFWSENELPQEAQEAYEKDPAEIQVFKTEDLILILSRRSEKEGVTLEVKIPKKDNKNEKRALKVLLNKKGIKIQNDKGNNKENEKNEKEDKEPMVRLTKKLLEVKNQEMGVEIAEKNIKIKEKKDGEVKLEENGIDLKKKKAIMKLTQEGIDMENGKSKMEIASSGIKVSNDGSSKMEINSDNINLENGEGASIKLSKVKVNINEGQMEVM